MSKQLNANFIAHESPLRLALFYFDLSLRYRKNGGSRVCSDAVLRYFWYGFGEFLSEPTVLRFHKTKRFPVNTNLVNFDAVFVKFFVRFLRPPSRPLPSVND